MQLFLRVLFGLGFGLSLALLDPDKLVELVCLFANILAAYFLITPTFTKKQRTKFAVTQVGQNWNQLLLELGAWYSFGRALEAEQV